jgi:glutamate-1-semialdehyde 2,1-aminomutase
MSERYFHSEETLTRALKTIPLGSQTFSKSKTQYPVGVSPLYLQKGLGSHVWDLDGNRYIDFVNGLGSIILGYGDPDVVRAVKAQLEDGVIFSLPHRLEVEVAEKVVEMVPCAEMVRFGKNGSDATAGAIRLARAFTGREHVAVCGYHGWQDWYIGSTARSLGVPKSTRELTHPFSYNYIKSIECIFEQWSGQIAAVILEPMNMEEPKDGFLQQVKELAHQNGALLIFDETITGFRFSNGGAQQLFGVTPDLATFGKGMSNGYPLSAVTGRSDIMALMEEIFFSSTFGGEALSLAAALSTMRKLQQQPVLQKLVEQGSKIISGVKELVAVNQIEDILAISGHPTWSFLLFQDYTPYSQWEIKTLFLQEVFRRGILTLGTHNMSYSHDDEDIARLLIVYSEVFPIIKKAVVNKTLNSVLQCDPLKPLFKVR